jgi:uncharacterized RDD family membrane protein YckC
MEDREPSMLRPGGALPVPPSARASGGLAPPAEREDAGGRAVWVAGFWRRALAALVDAAIVGPVALLAVWLAKRLAGLGLPPIRGGKIDAWLDLLLGGDPTMLGVLGLAAGTAAIYLMLFQTLSARTPGMRLLGLTVIDVYGEPPSALRSLLRTTGYFAAAALGGLGFLWIGFDREKRGLHDWLSGTYVIKPPPRARST